MKITRRAKMIELTDGHPRWRSDRAFPSLLQRDCQPNRDTCHHLRKERTVIALKKRERNHNFILNIFSFRMNSNIVKDTLLSHWDDIHRWNSEAPSSCSAQSRSFRPRPWTRAFETFQKSELRTIEVKTLREREREREYLFGREETRMRVWLTSHF